MSNPIESELPIQGMTCGSCVRHVQASLQAVPGVTHVSVDLRAARARVRHDLELASRGRLAAAVEEAGYSVPRN